MGISEDFRYALLVSIALRVFGVGMQLALLCVLLKWVLAGSSCLSFTIHVAKVPRAFRSLRWLSRTASPLVLQIHRYSLDPLRWNLQRQLVWSD